MKLLIMICLRVALYVTLGLIVGNLFAYVLAVLTSVYY